MTYTNKSIELFVGMMHHNYSKFTIDQVINFLVVLPIKQKEQYLDNVMKALSNDLQEKEFLHQVSRIWKEIESWGLDS